MYFRRATACRIDPLCRRSSIAVAAGCVPPWLLAQVDDPDWRSSCLGMIDKVRPYGWVRDDGAVRAHIVPAFAGKSGIA